MLKYYATREGKNLVLVLNHPFEVGIHWVPTDQTIEPWAGGITYCPRELPQGHPDRRDTCYLCFMAEHDKRLWDDMRVSKRTLWPVYDLTVMVPDELGLLWLGAGFRLNRQIKDLMGHLTRMPMAIWKTGKGLHMDYHANEGTVWGGTVMPLKYPVQPTPEVIIWPEERLARLFADPYTLDRPRELTEAFDEGLVLGEEMRRYLELQLGKD